MSEQHDQTKPQEHQDGATFTEAEYEQFKLMATRFMTERHAEMREGDGHGFHGRCPWGERGRGGRGRGRGIGGCFGGPGRGRGRGIHGMGMGHRAPHGFGGGMGMDPRYMMNIMHHGPEGMGEHFGGCHWDHCEGGQTEGEVQEKAINCLRSSQCGLGEDEVIDPLAAHTGCSVLCGNVRWPRRLGSSGFRKLPFPTLPYPSTLSASLASARTTHLMDACNSTKLIRTRSDWHGGLTLPYLTLPYLTW